MTEELVTSSWTWKQNVADCVVDLISSTGQLNFTLADVYGFETRLSQAFPGNRHVRDKVRQVLQQLRDDGFLHFRGGGAYELNLAHESVAAPDLALLPTGRENPITRDVIRRIRLRDTLLATEIRHRYTNTCQVCRQPVVLTPGRYYAEGHHVRPLGGPHFGPDVPGNIIVLCPNHHVMFDRGVIMVRREDLMVLHVCNDVLPHNTPLHLLEWHQLDPDLLEYHRRVIFEPVRLACNAK